MGTGHGHFCLVARQHWPEATFDGLDLSESVDEAARRGWVDTAYRGLFPELAGGLPRSYDVVSMHHYLEHTRDPGAELDAATKVLEPGGHLLIEAGVAEGGRESLRSGSEFDPARLRAHAAQFARRECRASLLRFLRQGISGSAIVPC